MGLLQAGLDRLLNGRVEPEQLDRLLRVTPLVSIMGTVAAVFAWILFKPYDPHAALGPWLAAICVVSAARLGAALYFRHVPATRRHTEAWLAWGVASTLVFALLWGAASLLLSSPGSAEAESLLHLVMASVAMGAAVHLSGLYPVLVIYVALVLGPLVMRDLLIGSAHHGWFALMSALTVLYTLVNGRHQSRAVSELLAQRRRNAELIEALRLENERSESARRAAEEASAARSRFFAAANHDLRQPLHAMGLFAASLDTPGASAGVAEVSRHLVECVDGMAQVVDELMELTRLDAGHLSPQITVFPLAPLVAECCQPYRAMARAKGLALTVEVGTPTVRSDRALLARVLSNLLANAVRYTCEGRVRVSAATRGERLWVAVEDTGIGIAREHLAEIFQEFYQVGNPARDRRFGLGLGLATVKRLSELLALDVKVRSEVNCGSLFELSLPLAAPSMSGSALPSQPDERPAALPRERAVLVIDDDADSRSSLGGLLRSWGCKVRTAACEADGLALLRGGFAPDALVADLRLTDGASGVDAVAATRAALGRPLPAVIVTGDAGSDHMQAAKAAGLAVMIKPVKPAQLRAFLGQAFAERP